MPLWRRTSTIAQAQKAMLFFDRQIALRAGGVVDPDAVDPGPAHQRCPRSGERLAWFDLSCDLEEVGSCFAVTVDGGYQRREHGQALAGACVHASLALASGLA
jgi:hypothetical protein